MIEGVFGECGGMGSKGMRGRIGGVRKGIGED